MNNHYCHGNILFVRVAIVSITTIIITSLLPYTITTVSTHAQSQSQPFEHAVTGSGELGAGARLMENYTIAAKVSNTTTSPELLNYAYNQGLAMGRGEGPNGRGDSAPGAVCPSGVDLEGAFCKAWVIGYEDGFAQTCNPKAAAASGDTCPPERRMHQPFHFIMTVCISDAGPLFLQGYYRAHVDFFNGQSYNQTLPMYNGTGNFYFDIRTGEKIPDDNVTGDYAAGYKIGWQDAKRGVFQVDC
jgi:hypothetical protein